MPWKATEPMHERIKLVADWLEGRTVTELSVMYGVSRRVIYKWIQRYEQHGNGGLDELSRAPRCHPNQTDDDIVECLVATKQLHMNWGPKKLLVFLARQRPDVNWPSVSVAEKWLRRNGLVRKRKYRRRVPPYSEPFLGCDAPNSVWSADYKGQFRTGDGRWCYPLTVSDNMSRYLLACKGLYSPSYAETRPWFEWAFREYGLPEAIRTDNGTPFAGLGVTALSRLSIWWIKLGIRPERIDSGKPQQNGRHERMHRTLKEDTATPPKPDMYTQQQSFDRFRPEYNDDRPHEALGMKTPASAYEPSHRRFPEKLREPEYDSGVEVRTVRRAGDFGFKRNYYFVSELLAGEKVGLVEVADGKYEIRFGFHTVAVLDLKLGRVAPNSTKV